MPGGAGTKAPARWYETFFGRDYLTRYVHRDTPADVDAIERILRLRKGAKVLDVATGAGRHAVELARRGYVVTGVDLSEPLLREARAASRRARARVTFARADMRRLRYTSAFDAAVSMFTSFGYFDRTEEDRQVLDGVARALKPRGKFLMEMFNRDHLASSLPQQSWRIRDDGSVVLEEDAFDPLHGRFETRQIVIDRKGTREYTGSVRAYTLAELKALFESSGLFLHRVLGGLDLSPYTPRSRRVVLYAVKGRQPTSIRTMW
ncbi:MAG: class I SAM-dependent methyltransferase [Methanobacteriota archaeon]